MRKENGYIEKLEISIMISNQVDGLITWSLTQEQTETANLEAHSLAEAGLEFTK